MRAAVVAVVDAAVSDAADIGTARLPVRFSRNTLRWAGNGLLQATRDGLRFTARREGLLGYALPRETLLVPVGRITSVYREAEVIRLQFRRDAGEEPASLEFSAETGGLAASIVGYLPAAQTVELDEPPRATAPSTAVRRARIWMYLVPLVAIGVIVAALLWQQREKPLAPAAIEQSHSPVEPEAISAHDLGALRAELQAVEARSAQLKEQFATELRRLMDGDISADDFALTLDRSLIPQWGREGTARSRRLARAATHARALELLTHSAGSWSLALSTYARGLRAQEPETVLEAFELLRGAEEYERQAYALLSETDGQP